MSNLKNIFDRMVNLDGFKTRYLYYLNYLIGFKLSETQNTWTLLGKVFIYLHKTCSFEAYKSFSIHVNDVDSKNKVTILDALAVTVPERNTKQVLISLCEVCKEYNSYRKFHLFEVSHELNEITRHILKEEQEINELFTSCSHVCFLDNYCLVGISANKEFKVVDLESNLTTTCPLQTIKLNGLQNVFKIYHQNLESGFVIKYALCFKNEVTIEWKLIEFNISCISKEIIEVKYTENEQENSLLNLFDSCLVKLCFFKGKLLFSLTKL